MVRAWAYLPDHDPPSLPGGSSRIQPGSRASIWRQASIFSSGWAVHRRRTPGPDRLGHSSVTEAVAFAELARDERLVLFHHDPPHTHARLDELTAQARESATSIDVAGGRDGDRYELAAK